MQSPPVPGKRGAWKKVRFRLRLEKLMHYLHPCIQETFLPAQKVYLTQIFDWCLEEGATSKQLAPLAGLIAIDWRYRITEAEIAGGLALAKKYGWDV